MPSRLNAACCTRSKMSRQVRHSPEHKRIRGRRGHVESSRATAISNVIPAINTWPKTAMVNSIWPLLGICLVPRQWTRCTKWQRIVNESLPPTVTPPPRKPAVGASRCAGAPACGVGLGCVQHFLELIHNVLLHEEPRRLDGLRSSVGSVARTLAAIDVNGLARHEARRFQIEDRAYDVRDLAHSAKRVQLRRAAHVFRRDASAS
jgi:hypothetical protein